MGSISDRLHQLQHEQKTRAPSPCAGQPEPEATGEDARKARTRRLIQLGALTDQYLETAGMDPEQAARLLNQLVQLSEVQHTINTFKQPV